MCTSESENRWNEDLSQTFMNYGRYFVPSRGEQIEIMVDLLSGSSGSIRIVELCSGEGLLAEAILECYPRSGLIGYDGSREMKEAAQRRLARFGNRFEARRFDLADRSWRNWEVPADAVVTSLAVHHLDDTEKACLFSDIHRLLAPGGVFIIADIINPTHPQSKRLAAKTYDWVVRERSLALDGDSRAFDFFQKEGWNIFRFLDPEDIDKPSPLYVQLKWLEKAGFEGVDVFWMKAGHAIFGGWKP